MRCRVLGKYVDAVGRGISEKAIRIDPVDGIVTDTAVQSKDGITIQTARNGAFVAYLAPGRYRFLFPDKKTYTVTVPDVARVRFEELVNHD